MNQVKPKRPQKVAYVHCAKGGKSIRFCRCGSVNCMIGNDYVVDTGNGQVYGRVIKVVDQEAWNQGAKQEKRIKSRVIRELNEKDREKLDRNADLEKKAFSLCEEKIKRSRLSMKLVKAYCLFDASKIVFYFTADTRVDFRNLVKDLAGEFHSRIEMKQIGVRDEAKMLGGYGGCGRPLCCSGFLGDFEPVSIRMAKIQNISLDPTKISGVCNRLMCCLSYESSQYESLRKVMPRIGERVTVNQDEGKVSSVDFVQEKVEVQLPGGTVAVGLEEYKRLVKPNQKKNEPSVSGGSGKAGRRKKKRRDSRPGNADTEKKRVEPLEKAARKKYS